MGHPLAEQVTSWWSLAPGMHSGQTGTEGQERMGEAPRWRSSTGQGLWPWVTVWVALRWGGCSPACLLLQDVGLLEYPHHPRDYTSHLSPSSVIQPQRRRPSLLSEFQPGNER